MPTTSTHNQLDMPAPRVPLGRSFGKTNIAAEPRTFSEMRDGLGDGHQLCTTAKNTESSQKKANTIKKVTKTKKNNLRAVMKSNNERWGSCADRSETVQRRLVAQSILNRGSKPRLPPEPAQPLGEVSHFVYPSFRDPHEVPRA